MPKIPYMSDEIQPKNTTPDPSPQSPIEELNEELLSEYGACPLCGRRITKAGDRLWCKNCGWRRIAIPAAERYTKHA